MTLSEEVGFLLKYKQVEILKEHITKRYSDLDKLRSDVWFESKRKRPNKKTLKKAEKERDNCEKEIKELSQKIKFVKSQLLGQALSDFKEINIEAKQK